MWPPNLAVVPPLPRKAAIIYSSIVPTLGVSGANKRSCPILQREKPFGVVKYDAAMAKLKPPPPSLPSPRPHLPINSPVS
ncbi:hypothetical protein DY000_02035052 [Brassica cretica]|uniref:Uncharacterized protein n=1 Tax=Brassica cretica TaxID=69181 RepID=A0ABQ7DWJ4_BRACR|nr:hypothetical protein DY000_02035052 [Brassica cretica]